MQVPIISALTAKILMIVEGVLDYFVTVTPAASADQCSPILGLSVSLTACGEEFVDTVAVVVNGVVEFVGPLLAGLNATETL